MIMNNLGLIEVALVFLLDVVLFARGDHRCSPAAHDATSWPSLRRPSWTHDTPLGIHVHPLERLDVATLDGHASIEAVFGSKRRPAYLPGIAFPPHEIAECLAFLEHWAPVCLREVDVGTQGRHRQPEDNGAGEQEQALRVTGVSISTSDKSFMTGS